MLVRDILKVKKFIELPLNYYLTESPAGVFDTTLWFLFVKRTYEAVLSCPANFLSAYQDERTQHIFISFFAQKSI